MSSKEAYMRRWLEMELMREEVMNNMDRLEPFILDPDLDLDDEVCEPTTEELEEDISPCGICQGCC